MSEGVRAKGSETYGSVRLGEKREASEKENRPITVGFVGNPNCGKTTLFNAFTGAKLKVANWPGVTVEREQGETNYKGRAIKVIDVAGI